MITKSRKWFEFCFWCIEFPFYVQNSTPFQDGSRQSENNLKFLNILKEPCEQLSKATASEIPPMLPKLLSLIRFVWTNSEFYNTKERITGESTTKIGDSIAFFAT